MIAIPASFNLLDNLKRDELGMCETEKGLNFVSGKGCGWTEISESLWRYRAHHGQDGKWLPSFLRTQQEGGEKTSVAVLSATHCGHCRGNHVTHKRHHSQVVKARYTNTTSIPVPVPFGTCVMPSDFWIKGCLLEFHELIHANLLEQCLVHSKPSNVSYSYLIFQSCYSVHHSKTRILSQDKCPEPKFG